jgi:hypothetical protein
MEARTRTSPSALALVPESDNNPSHFVHSGLPRLNGNGRIWLAETMKMQQITIV